MKNIFDAIRYLREYHPDEYESVMKHEFSFMGLQDKIKRMEEMQQPGQQIETEAVLWADDVLVMADVKPGQRCKGCGAPVEALVCAYCGRRFRIRDD